MDFLFLFSLSGYVQSLTLCSGFHYGGFQAIAPQWFCFFSFSPYFSVVTSQV